MGIEKPINNDEKFKWMSLKEVKEEIKKKKEEEVQGGVTAHFNDKIHDPDDKFNPDLLTESCAELYNMISMPSEKFTKEMYKVSSMSLDGEIENARTEEEEITLRVYRAYINNVISPQLNRDFLKKKRKENS